PRAAHDNTASRCLSRPAPLLFHGTLDHGLGLVSQLPPAAALSKRSDALQARSGARGIRTLDEQAPRQAAKRNLAIPIPEFRPDHRKGQPLFVTRRKEACGQKSFNVERAWARHLGVSQALFREARL